MSSKRSLLKPAWSEVLLLGLFAAFCSWQIFVPPYIGLANNGDFAKVYGHFSCAPRDGVERNFRYFVANYDFDPKYYWDGEVVSSEIALAAVAILPVQASDARVFNIRWLGAVHLLLWLAAYYALLVYLRRFGRTFQLAIGWLALWIFADVAYLAYFNSFFTDTAALLGLGLMVPLALSVASRQPARTAAVWLLTAAAILFITAKTQHALWGIFPAALLAWRRRFVPAALLLIAEVCIIVTVSPLYSVQGLFNVIFSKLAPQAPAPQQALRELGLGEDTFRYIGTNCYSPGSPFNTAEAMLAFNRRTSFGMVAHYWLRHPAEAFKAARGDLVNRAHDLRPPNLSNFRRQDGHPPFALTTRFASWSNLRSKMLRRWPVHIVAWYLLVIGVATGILFSRRPLPGPAVICLGIAAMGVLEFLLAALFDAVENERHLFLFHFMTDITICFAAAWALDAIMQVWKSRGSVMERSNSALVQVKSS